MCDLAEAHVKALKHLLEQKEASSYYDFFNIGTGDGTSVLQIIQAFEKITGEKVNYSKNQKFTFKPWEYKILIAD